MTPVKGKMIFLARHKRYQKEKPFSLRYNPLEDYVTENIERDIIEDVPINDIRDLPLSPNFDQNGFAICALASQMSYEDWFDDNKVRAVFFPELCKKIEEFFGTSHVQIFEYRIRRRSKAFPVATGNTLEWAQPATTTHIDFNLSEIRKMVYYHNGPLATELLNHRFQCVNVWKPLKGPVRDWPLALCDATSVSRDDLVTADVVYSDHVEENIQVHYNPKQRWLYLSDQQPEEMYFFRCADSWENKVGPGVPHAAFEYPANLHDGQHRESIEARVILYYGK